VDSGLKKNKNVGRKKSFPQTHSMTKKIKKSMRSDVTSCCEKKAYVETYTMNSVFMNQPSQFWNLGQGICKHGVE
jgi:hypothetical protein